MFSQIQKEEIITALKQVNALKVLVFGSYANGTENKESDLDLYVVTKDNYLPRSYHDKIRLKCAVSEKLDSVRRFFPIDLIVHTKPMHEKFKIMNSSFARDILNGGVVLYEADDE